MQDYHHNNNLFFKANEGIWVNFGKCQFGKNSTTNPLFWLTKMGWISVMLWLPYFGYEASYCPFTYINDCKILDLMYFPNAVTMPGLPTKSIWIPTNMGHPLVLANMNIQVWQKWVIFCNSWEHCTQLRSWSHLGNSL